VGYGRSYTVRPAKKSAVRMVSTTGWSGPVLARRGHRSRDGNGYGGTRRGSAWHCNATRLRGCWLSGCGCGRLGPIPLGGALALGAVPAAFVAIVTSTAAWITDAAVVIAAASAAFILTAVASVAAAAITRVVMAVTVTIAVTIAISVTAAALAVITAVAPVIVTPAIAAVVVFAAVAAGPTVTAAAAAAAMGAAASAEELATEMARWLQEVQEVANA